MTASNTLPNDKSDNSASLEKPECKYCGKPVLSDHQGRVCTFCIVNLEKPEPPQWGFAKVCRRESGELYWECEVDAEEGVTETLVIELAAITFNEGTIVRVYEPIE